jgi:hypothetical protein
MNYPKPNKIDTIKPLVRYLFTPVYKQPIKLKVDFNLENLIFFNKNHGVVLKLPEPQSITLTFFCRSDPPQPLLKNTNFIKIINWFKKIDELP